MSILYVGGALLVILLNIENFPHAFYSIFVMPLQEKPQ